MQIKKRVLIALAVIFVFFSCEKSENASELERTYIVASKKIDCDGVAPQKCFLVKEKIEDNWIFFYSNFNEFNYEEGFEYKILVLEKEIENPAQDDSSIEYNLIKIISKVEKTSENLPQ